MNNLNNLLKNSNVSPASDLYQNYWDDNKTNKVVVTSMQQISNIKQQNSPPICDTEAAIAIKAAKMVDMLACENESLRKTLEQFEKKLGQIQNLEVALENTQRGHDILIQANEKREQLEKLVRTKLEAEIHKLKDQNCRLLDKLHTLSVNDSQHCPPAYFNNSTMNHHNNLNSSENSVGYFTNPNTSNLSLAPHFDSSNLNIYGTLNPTNCLNPSLGNYPPAVNMQQTTMLESLTTQLNKKDVVISQLIAQNKDLLTSNEKKDLDLAAKYNILTEQSSQLEVLQKALLQAQTNVLRLEEIISSLADHFPPFIRKLLKDQLSIPVVSSASSLNSLSTNIVASSTCLNSPSHHDLNISNINTMMQSHQVINNNEPHDYPERTYVERYSQGTCEASAFLHPPTNIDGSPRVYPNASSDTTLNRYQGSNTTDESTMKTLLSQKPPFANVMTENGLQAFRRNTAVGNSQESMPYSYAQYYDNNNLLERIKNLKVSVAKKEALIMDLLHNHNDLASPGHQLTGVIPYEETRIDYIAEPANYVIESQTSNKISPNASSHRHYQPKVLAQSSKCTSNLTVSELKSRYRNFFNGSKDREEDTKLITTNTSTHKVDDVITPSKKQENNKISQVTISNAGQTSRVRSLQNIYKISNSNNNNPMSNNGSGSKEMSETSCLTTKSKLYKI